MEWGRDAAARLGKPVADLAELSEQIHGERLRSTMPIFKINHSNILFVHIPKAGGTSVERWLGNYSPIQFHTPLNTFGFPCVPQHFHGELISALFDLNFFHYKFSVVRNPYSRLLSEYNYRMSHRRSRERIFPRPGFERWVAKVLRQYPKNPYIYSNHIRRQVEFLVDDIEVFRLESDLPELHQRLLAICGIASAADFPFANRSTARESTISEAAAHRIYRFYREDFDKFGYDRDSYQNLGTASL
jgi:hypothetical protein